FDIGIYVFFTLSAYLLGAPFIKAFIRGGDFPRVTKYFRNRVLRVMPAFLAAWAATWIIVGSVGTSVGRILAVPAFVQVYFPSHFEVKIVQAWTLDVEGAFYVL